MPSRKVSDGESNQNSREVKAPAFLISPLSIVCGIKVENALRKLLDPAESSDFCHRLVLFGREHCTARSPKCEGCPLGAVCPSYPIAK